MTLQDRQVAELIASIHRVTNLMQVVEGRLFLLEHAIQDLKDTVERYGSSRPSSSEDAPGPS